MVRPDGVEQGGHAARLVGLFGELRRLGNVDVVVDQLVFVVEEDQRQHGLARLLSSGR